ncbi:MAG: isoleucine--tRNA ligase [Bdellovibrionales bacterium]
MADQQKVEYKDSLNLPQTDFPMKANLPVREPKILEEWDKSDIYQKMANRNQRRFSMPDGPPYANGNIHVGHVLNKVLKDIVIKYKNMNGYSAAFIPGWDCHGLPIELGVTKKLGSKRKEITDNEFREHCREFAMKWVNTQMGQFQRLGVMAEWDKPYLTLQKEYEAEEVRQLAKMVDTGAFYKGEKPVFWCWALQTALADTEVEYHDHTSPTVYVKFEAKAGLDKIGNPKKKTSFVIWTTTPWTLPANLGICLGSDIDYAFYEHEDEYLIFAEALVEQIESDTEMKFKKVEGSEFKGSAAENMLAHHPFIERDSLIMLGDHVTLEAGTGMVHTAPGHGMEDYMVGKQYGLDTYSPVDIYGKYTNEVPEYEGTLVFDANPLIVERLKESNHLLHSGSLHHSYPHCWRTKKPLIYRATTQWFLEMDNEKHNIRQKALAAIKEVNWVPAWGQNRITAMVENRPDWCLSRQRLWGVPIPIFYCESCDKDLVDSDIMRTVAEDMENNNGLITYFETDTSKYTAGKKCECGSESFRKGTDILDVWFDSGVCHAAVQDQREALSFPGDLYLEGSDQHRGWFQTSLLTAIAAKGQAPYKTVLTHGFVNDLQGKKMSKSLGNVVDPAKVIQKYGAEILRLWTAYEDYAQDLTCGEESFKRLSETYRRLRNTMRFLIGNIHDFDPSKDYVAFADLTEMDRWALTRLNGLIDKSTQAYDAYDFYKIYHALNNFATVEMSATYLDILKDRLYTSKKDGPLRRSAQTVLFELCKNFCGLMAPILSFLAEETYSHLPGDKAESIFLTDFPKTNPEWKDDSVVKKFEALLEVKPEVSKVLEGLRRDKTIGSSLEAKVKISAKDSVLSYLKEYEEELADFLIVSQVELTDGEFTVEAIKAEGDKCPRCWKYKNDIGSNSKAPDVCGTCAEAII